MARLANPPPKPIVPTWSRRCGDSGNKQKPGDPQTQLMVGGFLQEPASGVLLPMFHYYREQTHEAAAQAPSTNLQPLYLKG